MREPILQVWPKLPDDLVVDYAKQIERSREWLESRGIHEVKPLTAGERA